jgi:hypothetical protein
MRSRHSKQYLTKLASAQIPRETCSAVQTDFLTTEVGSSSFQRHLVHFWTAFWSFRRATPSLGLLLFFHRGFLPMISAKAPLSSWSDLCVLDQLRTQPTNIIILDHRLV